MTIDGEMGAAVRLGRRRQLRRSRSAASIRSSTRRRCRSRRRSASSSTSSTSRTRASTPRATSPSPPTRSQFGAHAELLLRLLGAVGRGQLRLRRADPVLAVPLHRRRSRTSFSRQGVRARRLWRRHRPHARGPDAAGTRNGTASLSFFFFSIDIDIDFSWGDDAGHERCRRSRSCRCLRGELGKQSNWRAVLPPGSNLLVSLRQLDPAEAAFVLHPGRHAAGQPAAGAARPHARQGRQPEAERRQPLLADGERRRARQGAQPAGAVRAGPVPEHRRRRQALAAGLRACRTAASSSPSPASPTHPARRSPGRCATTRPSSTPSCCARRAVSSCWPAPSSPTSCAAPPSHAASCRPSARRRPSPFSATVTVAAETFVVAVRSDNTLFRSDAAAFTSQAAADDYVARAVARDPALDGTLHVLPQFEMAA